MKVHCVVLALCAAVVMPLVGCGGASDEPAAAPSKVAGDTRARVANATTTAAAASPWSAYVLAPSSRIVAPVAVRATTGTTQNANNLLGGDTAMMSGRGSSITLDFGKEVGGLVSVTFPEAGSASESVGLAFTESSDYIGPVSDGSNTGLNVGAQSSTDGAIYASVNSASGVTYAAPAASLRGGFRYLTLFMNSNGWVHLSNVRLNFTAAPTMADPSAYPNWFYSSDDLLNRIWYAGAYTTQLSTIAPNQGRQLISTGWDNTAVVSGGTTVLTDAAKRDRAVWPGDLGVSTATAFVSTADTLSSRNALQQMYDMQKSSGELPYAGPPFNLYGSDTYHLWSLIGTWNYYLYSGDLPWVRSIWTKYRAGIAFALAKTNGAHGLMNVTGTADWARGNQGDENIAANAMLYHALVTGAQMATAQGDATDAQSWTQAAASLKTKINATLWDGATGAYRDRPSSTLYPQDGNSLAVWFGVTDTPDKDAAIARALQGNVGALGAHTPEWSGNISPFAGSMALMALSQAYADTDALNLMRREWGYMLGDATRGTSTFWEGYGADGGSGGYAAWFASHAHGWATGPTSALTFYTLGIHPTNAQGTAYEVIPHPGDLSHVEGRLGFGGAKGVLASWTHAADGSFTLAVDSTSNTGSTGTIAIPRFGLSRTIKRDGVLVWDGNNFVAAAGIASADQDDRYVYFRGTVPRASTFVAAAQSSTWTTCASEAGHCTYDGVRGVRYGAGSTFVYRSQAGGVDCSNATFGDPMPNVVKHCELSDTELPPLAGAWVACADEGATCTFAHSKTVAYGARGAYAFAAASGSIACGNTSFPDPIYGVAKHCYVAIQPQDGGFEAPVTSTYSYAPPGTAWTFSAQVANGGSGVEHDDSAFGASAAPEGLQAAFLQDAGAVVQTLPDLAAGTYAVRFQVARRGAPYGAQTVGVWLDGTLVGTVTPASTQFSAYTSAPIALAAGNHTLKLAGQNTDGDNTAFVDAIEVLNF